ncbi:uncharacterized protein SPSC_06137 [Sporisorium scitamineum]|uniref:Uncharacterized protein n=1 Tax=Sporisorium scitamineum TaxID=49012 RepID=A0A127ZIX2_9BASI|nr:uncharacterized protein SPSC_06137 [Sporisorium scitamineum]
MERREALVAQQVAQQTIQQTGQFRNNINSKTLPADLANPHVLIAYLHMYALKGKGRMNADKVAHTNLRGSERTDRAEALQANFAFDDSDEEQDDFDEEDGQDDEYADGQAESQISTQADQHATSTLKHYRPGRDSRKHD